MNLRKNTKLLTPILLIIAGSISWSLTMIKSGLVYNYGMGFWGANGHDGIWHLSLINQLAKFSLNNPVFAGEKLANYHFGFDFLIAVLHLITRIPVINLYFQVLPPIMAVLIGILTFNFVKKWTNSEKGAWWATFFVYFGGSWGWLVNFIRSGSFGEESMFWASQSTYTLINPPYALSLIIILFGLIKFLDFKRSQKRKDLIICSLLFGLLAIIKVYAGIIILGGLVAGTLINNLIYRKKETIFLKVFTLSLVITLVTFLPFNRNASSLLVFQPFWFLRTMLTSTDRFFWPKLENARLAYLHSGRWFKWASAEILIFLIFVLGNLGTRVLAVFEIRKRFKLFSLPEVELIVFAGMGISFLIPFLFIQKGTPWNTIQFFYYFQIMMGILSGIWLGKIFENKSLTKNFPVKAIITASLILITIPTTVAALAYNFIPSHPPARISMEELEALGFLKKQPDGIVLTYPYDETWRGLFSEPKPLYAYETTGYVSALTGKQSFLEDEMNLEISGYDWRERREDILKFFNTNQRDYAADLIINNKIVYLYIIKGQPFNLGENDINAEKIFENGEVRIYQIYK